MTSMHGRHGRAGDTHKPDPLGEAIAAFLTDLLDNTAVALHTDDDGVAQDGETRLPVAPILGADGRRRQFSLRTTTARPGAPASGTGFPPELGDLPAAALRALERMASASVAADQIQPSLARALNDVVVVEVLADRLMRRLDVDDDLQADVVTGLVARTLDYTIELAATRIEGKPVTHGVVLCADLRGRRPLEPRLDYPGRLPTRKRTPLLFDGTESALAVTATGATLGEINRASVPLTHDGRGLGDFDAALGINGALIAAASAAFSGVGVYVRADGSIWIFDEGKPLFIRRTTKWKSIALANFSERLVALSRVTSGVVDVVARAVLRASIQGTGALFAVASNDADLVDLIAPKDFVPARGSATSTDTVDGDLHTLLHGPELVTPSGLARLARLDGATVVSADGALVAYGAIVRSADSRGEGARTAAARTLSLRADLAVSVSQDGPVSVFHHGEVVLELL